jgi:hypothetical protein
MQSVEKKTHNERKSFFFFFSLHINRFQRFGQRFCLAKKDSTWARRESNRA